MPLLHHLAQSAVLDSNLFRPAYFLKDKPPARNGREKAPRPIHSLFSPQQLSLAVLTLGKTHHVRWVGDIHRHWVKVWRNGTFPETSHVLPIAVTGHWVTEWSTSGSLGKFSQARKATPELYRMSGATPPHVHSTSMYIPALDEFYQAFPRVSTASDKRWVRRPGYEASLNSHLPCI